MLGTVLKDKEKIEQTIEELDRYKRDALKTTWEKVNGYARAAPSQRALPTNIYTGTLVASLQNCSQGTSPSYSLQTDKT
jgi:hypothetical protein